MQVEVGSAMRLSGVENVDFGEYQHYVVQDVGFLSSVATRMIEDIELVAYILARQQDTTVIDSGIVATTLRLYCQESEEAFGSAPATAIINPEFVAERAKSPFFHDEAARVMVAKFVNFHLAAALFRAAAQAREEGVHVITALHFSWCHLLPYPFNIYLC